MNGIVCINKPPAFTSFDVIAKARGILRLRKMGHAGTLDPMATGVLPVFLGGATKAIGLMEDHDKEYVATLRLGMETDTQDVWGTVTRTAPPADERALEAVLPRFRGEIWQTPPMYSAVQVGGRRLYDLARAGVEVERPARKIAVYALELLGPGEAPGEYRLRVRCSKGSYIRTLCADIGAALGCGGAMAALCRTHSCGFSLSDCVTLEQLQALRDTGAPFPVLPLARAFPDLPQLTVTRKQAARFLCGAPLAAERLKRPVEGRALVFAPDGTLLGLGEAAEEALRPVKLFCAREEFLAGADGTQA